MPLPHVHVPYDKINDHLDFIRSNRLNLEIYFSSYALDILTAERIGLLQKALDYDPSLSIHAPFMDLSPGAVDSRVRRATLERFLRVLDVAEVLRPKTIVFHSGYEKWKYALQVEPWLTQSAETWSVVNERAAPLGVTIAVENIFEDEPSNLRLLVERLKSPNFGICFDTGHFNLFSKAPLQDWLAQLGPFIRELHLHDNNGKADSHRPIGDGTFDFDTLFSSLDVSRCICTVESHSPERVLTSIARLRKYLPA